MSYTMNRWAEVEEISSKLHMYYKQQKGVVKLWEQRAIMNNQSNLI